MDAKSPVECPQCGSTDVESDYLTVRGQTDPVFFGSRLFQKKRLVAYACSACDYVFFYLEREED